MKGRGGGERSTNVETNFPILESQKSCGKPTPHLSREGWGICAHVLKYDMSTRCIHSLKHSVPINSILHVSLYSFILSSIFTYHLSSYHSSYHHHHHHYYHHYVNNKGGKGGEEGRRGEMNTEIDSIFIFFL